MYVQYSGAVRVCVKLYRYAHDLRIALQGWHVTVVWYFAGYS